jgi:hypothetical protein
VDTTHGREQQRLERLVAEALQRPGVADVLRVYGASVSQAQPAQTVVTRTRTVANANDLAR